MPLVVVFANFMFKDALVEIIVFDTFVSPMLSIQLAIAPYVSQEGVRPVLSRLSVVTLIQNIARALR